ncbi:MAG: tRNA pseudouridine(38-40) synthase TruA [Chloroflexi bacterium RBG_13_57_8]|nr:MAG: tRNA pseudouridine(38-40) synthase TruA [Chloroflexi bacterium RBG_13_57_8]
MRIILIVEYDGTGYHGSQYQANAPTVQGEIEKALKMLTGEKIRVKMAGRTDAGVHARGQVVAFDTAAAIPLKSFVAGLNHFLPEDIAVKEARHAADGFDVRRHAVSREYRYQILCSPTRSPLRQKFACRVEGDLDAAAMDRASRALIGRHDFASFVASEGAARQKRTVRDVFEAGVTREGDTVTFRIVASSFLPHQVRNTVGPLILVGQGRMTPAEFSRMVEAAEPGLAGPTAPAAGLCLTRVNYPVDVTGDAA